MTVAGGSNLRHSSISNHPSPSKQHLLFLRQLIACFLWLNSDPPPIILMRFNRWPLPEFASIHLAWLYQPTSHQQFPKAAALLWQISFKSLTVSSQIFRSGRLQLLQHLESITAASKTNPACELRAPHAGIRKRRTRCNEQKCTVYGCLLCYITLSISLAQIYFSS